MDAYYHANPSWYFNIKISNKVNNRIKIKIIQPYNNLMFSQLVQQIPRYSLKIEKKMKLPKSFCFLNEWKKFYTISDCNSSSVRHKLSLSPECFSLRCCVSIPLWFCSCCSSFPGVTDRFWGIPSIYGLRSLWWRHTWKWFSWIILLCKYILSILFYEFMESI